MEGREPPRRLEVSLRPFSRFSVVPFLLLVLPGAVMAGSDKENERVLYTDITSVNTSDCLNVIERLPLR